MFTLTGVKPDEIDKQYEFKSNALLISENFIPCQSTKISELHSFNQTLTVVDELKNAHNARISSVFSGSIQRYCCFWDRHPLTDDTGIYCPIEKIHHPRIKNYISNINGKSYKIQDSMQPAAYQEYFVDGIFCSVECCLAYIDQQRHDPLYQNAEMHLRDIFSLSGDHKAAPHWRLLSVYGGNLSIEEFRKSFTNTLFTPDGIVYHPISFLYRENYHL